MHNLKKPWVSIILILLAAVGGIAGTFAYFTATRTAELNKFAAGTLDLNVMGDNAANEPFVIENMGANANIDGTKTWTITNTGTLPGRLLFRITDLVNLENGCNDQEKATEPGCDLDIEGELGGKITLKVDLDAQLDVVQSTLATADMLTIGDNWNDSMLPVIMPAGSTRTITVHWATDENAYGNEIQSDSVTFDTVFQLIQDIDGPTPANQGTTNEFGNQDL